MHARWIIAPAAAVVLCATGSPATALVAGGTGVLVGAGLLKTDWSKLAHRTLEWTRRGLCVITGCALHAFAATGHLESPGLWAAGAAWAAGSMFLWPRRSRAPRLSRQVVLPLPAPRVEAIDPEADRRRTFEMAPAAWAADPRQAWNLAIAREAAPGVTMLEYTAGEDGAFTAVLHAGHGQPMPHLDLRKVEAMAGLPAKSLELEPVEGASPSYGRLRSWGSGAASDGYGSDLERDWARLVAGAGGPAPGTRVRTVRRADNGVRVLIERNDGEPLSVDVARLATKLGLGETPELLVVDKRNVSAVVSIYDRDPLASMPNAALELLQCNDAGEVTLGLTHDGKPGRIKLIDPKRGAVHSFVVGMTGSGKSQLALLCVIAERVNGIASRVLDCGGAGMPELEGRVPYFKGVPAVLQELQRLTREAAWRKQELARLGVGSIADLAPEDQPFPYLNVSIDEFNALSRWPDAKARKRARAICETAVSEWRKLGIGFRILGQSLLLADMLGSNVLREQGRSGGGVMLRVASDMTARKSLEGLVDDTDTIVNVPPYVLRPLTEEELLAGAEEEKQPTYGAGYVLDGARALKFRALNVSPKIITGMLDATHEVLTGDGWQGVEGMPVPAAKGDADDEDGDDDYGDGEDWADDADDDADDPQEEADGPATVADVILRVLADTDDPMQTADIVSAVRARLDVGSGAVQNKISDMARSGEIARLKRGLYRLASVSGGSSGDDD